MGKVGNPGARVDRRAVSELWGLRGEAIRTLLGSEVPSIRYVVRIADIGTEQSVALVTRIAPHGIILGPVRPAIEKPVSVVWRVPENPFLAMRPAVRCFRQWGLNLRKSPLREEWSRQNPSKETA